MLHGFDCHCKGENIKHIEKVKISRYGKICEVPVFRWFARENYHFCYVLLPEGLAYYYHSECYRTIMPVNETYFKIQQMIDEHRHIWIRCRTDERIRKVEGILYDIYNPTITIYDTTGFARFVKSILVKETEIPSIAVISGLKEQMFLNKYEEWQYIGALETLQRETKHLIILSLKNIFLKNFSMKEIRDEEL